MARIPAVSLLLPLLAAGCFSGVGGETSQPNPTLVAVAPEDFLGDVPCADAPGALQTYVVRLFDHGSSEEPQNFELPASVINIQGVYRPVSCNQAAVFGHVVPSHKYSAIVEAYDRADLRALGPGSAILLDPSGKPVPPRWTTRCGRDAEGNATTGAVVSAFYTTRFVRGCEPLTSDQPPTDTALSVNVTNLANTEGKAIGCGSGVGQIERFQARFVGNPGSMQEAACGESVTFSNLTPGGQYRFEVAAFEGGQTAPRWGTTCFRVAESGATLEVACDALAEEGIFEIDVSALLELWALGCGPGAELMGVSATLGEDTLTSCTNLSFSKAPGSYTAQVSSIRWDDTPGPGAVCSGEVMPGWVTRPTCTALPIGP